MGDAFILDPDQVAAFRRDGYLVVEEVIGQADLAELEAIYGSFMRGEVEGMGRDFCDMSGPYERAFDDWNIVNAVLPRAPRAPSFPV